MKYLMQSYKLHSIKQVCKLILHFISLPLLIQTAHTVSAILHNNIRNFVATPELNDLFPYIWEILDWLSRVFQHHAYPFQNIRGILDWAGKVFQRTSKVMFLVSIWERSQLADRGNLLDLGSTGHSSTICYFFNKATFWLFFCLKK